MDQEKVNPLEALWNSLTSEDKKELIRRIRQGNYPNNAKFAQLAGAVENLMNRESDAGLSPKSVALRLEILDLKKAVIREGAPTTEKKGAQIRVSLDPAGARRASDVAKKEQAELISVRSAPENVEGEIYALEINFVNSNLSKRKDEYNTVLDTLDDKLSDLKVTPGMGVGFHGRFEQKQIIVEANGGYPIPKKLIPYIRSHGGVVTVTKTEK